MSHATDNPQGKIDTNIRISSGRLVNLNAFTPEDVDLFSINRSLNNLRRFTGHYKFSRPLSVAQHTMLVKMIADRLYPSDGGTRLMCIIHDFGEAYYCDLSSPLKRHLGASFKDRVKHIDDVILNTLWSTENSPDLFEKNCKMCDHISLRIEQFMMFKTEPPEEYVKDFMMKYDIDNMFNLCYNKDVDLVQMYKEASVDAQTKSTKEVLREERRAA